MSTRENIRLIARAPLIEYCIYNGHNLIEYHLIVFIMAKT